MNKISKVFILGIYLLMLFVTCSCKKIYLIDSSKATDFINEYYLYLTDQKNDFLALDLRSLDLYEISHLKGFNSYAFYQDSLTPYQQDDKCEQFISWIKQNYDVGYTIFLVDLDGTMITSVVNKLKNNGYKKIYAYKGGYDALIKENTIISLAQGLDDCGC